MDKLKISIKVVLAIPVIVFYAVLLYPWDFQQNRGFGWMMLLALIAWSVLCLLVALIALFFAWNEQKKSVWVLLFLLNLLPSVHTFLVPALIQYFG